MPNTTNWARDRHVLEREFGIYLPSVTGYVDEMRANDAALTPVNFANAAIPSQYTTYLEPDIIDILTSPTKVAEVYGEAQKGDWLHDTMQFITLENGGEVAPYGDFSNSGTASVVANFPQRQQFIIQTISQVGDREAGRAGRINVDLVNKKRKAAVTTVNYWQNTTYLYGVQNLENYGVLTDPNLPTPIAPLAKVSGSPKWKTATAMEIYDDISALYQELQSKANGLINLDTAMDMNSELKLVISNEVQPYLLKTNEYGYSVTDLLKKNYPNLKQYSIPQFSLAAGELVQMFAPELGGQQTFICAFSEKLRSHGIFRVLSSVQEKLSQGSWGTILINPIAVAQMQGV